MRPLEGTRVIEVTTTVAGPVAGRICADLGAETIKIEAVQRPDMTRGLMFIDNEPGPEHWNRGGSYHSVNLGKLSLSLNVEKPGGKDIFRQLVEKSDVVIENLSARVFPAWGLDYSDLVQIKPDIIMLSLTGYGRSGPHKDKVAYQPVMEAAGGLTYVTGAPDGLPRFSDTQYADVMAGAFGAMAVLQALIKRRKTGRGQHIDLAGREAMLSMIGELIVDFSLTGRMPERTGNADLVAAPQGVYRCRGNDRWIAISVCGDQQWRCLVEVMGIDALAEDDRFGSAQARRANAALLDEMIEQWTMNQDDREAARRLQGKGIAAASLLNVKEVVESQHLNQRDFFSWSKPMVDEIERPYPKLLPGMPTSYGPTKPAPRLGEHNDYVLSGLLGLTQAQIAKLEQEGTIGSTPEYDFRPATLNKPAALNAGCAFEEKDFRHLLEELAQKYRR